MVLKAILYIGAYLTLILLLGYTLAKTLPKGSSADGNEDE